MSAIVRSTLVALALTQTGAFAQKSPPRPAPQAAPAKHVIFDEGDRVLGEFERPGGSEITSRGNSRFSSMLKPRPDFFAEMHKSAENL